MWRNLRNWSQSKSMHKIREVLFNLHKTQIYNCDISSTLWNNKKFPNHKTVIQQLFVQKIGQLKLTQLLISTLYKKKNLIYPLPRNWQNSFQANEIIKVKINVFLSTLLFISLITFSTVSNFLNAFLFIIKITLKKIFQFYLKKNDKEYYAICNFPLQKAKLSEQISKYNIIDWLKKERGVENFVFLDPSASGIKNINNSKIVNNINDILLEDLNIINFILDSTKYVLFCLIDLLFLRYGSLLLLGELLQYSVVKNSNSKKINFMFVWTNNIYRPLWTYGVENTPEIFNLSIFGEIRDNLKNNLSYDFEGYFLSTWEIFNVWTIECKNFIEQRTKNKIKVNVVGLIYSYNNNVKIELPKNKKIIAIFPYETHRFSAGISTIGEYQNSDLFHLQKFFADIIDCVKDDEIYLAIKRKKAFNSQLEKKYIRNIYEKLKNNNKIIYINHECSPYRLIEETNCTISLPFTSTSVAASFLNKKSIYYDPIKKLNMNDPSSCGIELINQKNDLKKWINSQFDI